MYTSTRCFQHLKLQTKSNAHKKRFHYQKNRNCLETIQRKRFHYQKNRIWFWKKEPSQKKRFYSTEKQELQTLKKYKNRIYLKKKGDHKNRKKKEFFQPIMNRTWNFKVTLLYWPRQFSPEFIAHSSSSNLEMDSISKLEFLEWALSYKYCWIVLWYHSFRGSWTWNIRLRRGLQRSKTKGRALK